VAARLARHHLTVTGSVWTLKMRCFRPDTPGRKHRSGTVPIGSLAARLGELGAFVAVVEEAGLVYVECSFPPRRFLDR
jgi:hypothetical protein